tara:strand:+ start:449 stop:808 length:360 start_codon:yes stop_codon:yes gene_type:complete
VGRYKLHIDRLDELSVSFSETLIRDGFSKGFNIPTQIIWFEKFCNVITKQVENCQKVKCSDFQMFLATKLALYRLKKTSANDFLFLKDKKTSFIIQKKNDTRIYNAYIKRKEKTSSKKI